MLNVLHQEINQCLLRIMLTDAPLELSLKSYLCQKFVRDLAILFASLFIYSQLTIHLSIHLSIVRSFIYVFCSFI